MAGPYYVRSTDGNDADSGLTWALAKATVAGALAVAVAGERVWVSQVHAETAASVKTLTAAGTLASPVEILCGNDAAEPPTALATTATVTTTGTSNITIAGCIYMYGIQFSCGTGSGTTSFNVGNAATAQFQYYEICAFRLVHTSIGDFNVGNTLVDDGGQAIFKNCSWKFAAVGQSINARNFDAKIIGGSCEAGGTTPTNVFSSIASETGKCVVTGFDFSNLAATVNFNPATVPSSSVLDLISCKLPASWSGALFAAAPTSAGMRIRLHNCDSGDTNYKVWEEDTLGSVRDETTLVRTGGASDGTTALAFKLTSSANAVYPHQTSQSQNLSSEWNETVGSSKTVTAEIIQNSFGLLDDAEAWIDVSYLGTAGVPLALMASDAKASILATAANQTASTEAWDSLVTARANSTVYSVGDMIKVASNAGRVFFCTTAGTTAGTEPAGFASAVDGGSVTDNTATFRAGWRQKLAVAITPQEKGVFVGTVHLAKPSATLYFCPKLTVT